MAGLTHSLIAALARSGSYQTQTLFSRARRNNKLGDGYFNHFAALIIEVNKISL
jgi:hypothetical protein